jgi:hypothetical protein
MTPAEFATVMDTQRKVVSDRPRAQHRAQRSQIKHLSKQEKMVAGAFHAKERAGK